MGGIFISYRREDAAPWAGRLYERLARDFPRNQLFMDVDAIEPGLDFFTVLDDQVASCDVLLAIIGPAWVEARNKQGIRRLDDPEDFVRIELGSALKRDIRVIPVLINGAPMPHADELPEALKPLTRRHAVEVSHARFGSDTQGLVEVLQRVVSQPAVPSPTGWLGRMFSNGATPRHVSSPRLQARAPAVSPATPEMVKPASSEAAEFAPAIRRADLAALRGASSPDKPVVTASWGPVIIASVFALAALPMTFAIGVQFEEKHWSWLGVAGDGPAASGFLMGAMLVAVSALVLARLRGAALTGVEVALYWMGSSLAVGFAMAVLFDVMTWSWLGAARPGPVFSGVLAGAILAAISGVVLLVYFRRRSTA